MKKTSQKSENIINNMNKSNANNIINDLNNALEIENKGIQLCYRMKIGEEVYFNLISVEPKWIKGKLFSITKNTFSNNEDWHDEKIGLSNNLRKQINKFDAKENDIFYITRIKDNNSNGYIYYNYVVKKFINNKFLTTTQYLQPSNPFQN